MLYPVFLYLLKGTLYLSVFTLTYRWLFSGFTHFHWMRFYLVGSVLLSMVLPLVQIPAFLTAGTVTAENGSFPFHWTFLPTQPIAGATAVIVSRQSFSIGQAIGYLLLGVYVPGLLYKIGVISKNLLNLRRFIANNQRVEESGYYLVNVSQNLPAFSFWRYIFLSSPCRQLPIDELQQIKQHELVHIQQYHTLDLLFFEIAGAVFWFNPLLNYLKKALRHVHEFLADAVVAGKGESQKTYAHLLLKLSAIPQAVPLANGFSDKQISQRIVMLTKARSLPQQKYIFLLMLPLTILLLLLSSCLDEPENNAQINGNKTAIQQTGVKIGKITWNGNTVYTDDELNHILGIKTGDGYNKQELEKHINYNPDGEDLSSLYLDQGYLFYNVEIEEQATSPEVVSLTLNVFEGKKVKIGKIIIQGNQTVATNKILSQIPFKTGELFNRSKLIEGQRAIANMGYFDSEKVGIYPIPDATARAVEEGGSVDIEFTVIETKTN